MYETATHTMQIKAFHEEIAYLYSTNKLFLQPEALYYYIKLSNITSKSPTADKLRL